MEAISKKSGKVFTGKVAELMVRIGAATPAGEEYVKPIEKQVKHKPRAKKSEAKLKAKK